MTLLNKYILNENYSNFNHPNILVLWQNAITVVLMLIKRHHGQASFTFEWKIAAKWLVANLIFVAMLSTSVFAVKDMAVPMVTVFKNLAVCLTAIGDKYLFGAKHSEAVILSIGLMIFGSFAAAITDLNFLPGAYSWMFFHVLSSAAYVLYIRKMKKEINLSED